MIILQNEMNVVSEYIVVVVVFFFACILSFFDLDLVFMQERRGQFGEMNVKVLMVLKSEPKPGLNYDLRTHFTQHT